MAAQLIGGPYELRACRQHDEILCAVHGLQVIAGFFGPMQWPRAKVRGRPQIIVCDGLLDALSIETRDTIAFHWGVHLRTVANWRRALAMTNEVSRAVHSLRSAAMLHNHLTRPDAFKLPGKEHLEQLDHVARQRLGWTTAGERVWTDEDLQQVLTHDSRTVSARLGRSLNAVRSARYRALRRKAELDR